MDSGWGTHVYLWRIHFDIWQNQYNIVKLKNKKRKNKKKKITTLEGNIDSGGGYTCVGAGNNGASLYFLLSFAVNPKLFKKDCLNKKENKIKDFLFKAKKKKV